MADPAVSTVVALDATSPAAAAALFAGACVGAPDDPLPPGDGRAPGLPLGLAEPDGVTEGAGPADGLAVGDGPPLVGDGLGIAEGLGLVDDGLGVDDGEPPGQRITRMHDGLGCVAAVAARCAPLTPTIPAASASETAVNASRRFIRVPSAPRTCR